MLLLSYAVAVLHGAAVLLMVTGALFALRRPWLLYLHVPVALTILAFHLAGAPCPLTTLELELRTAAGAAPYDGGFLGHYVLAPFGVDVRTTAAQAGIYTVAIVPNAIAYALHVARAVRSRAVRRQGITEVRGPDAIRGSG